VDAGCFHHGSVGTIEGANQIGVISTIPPAIARRPMRAGPAESTSATARTDSANIHPSSSHGSALQTSAQVGIASYTA
jgi:hypothetical protein